MANFNHEHFEISFQNWITQQHQDLEELLNSVSNDDSDEITDDKLKPLIDKGIRHFEEYMERRAMMATKDAPSFLCPSWCSSYENSCLWIGGCRPSLSVRLVYSVCGSELNGNLADFLRGERKGNLAELSANQLDSINTLHCKIVKEEEKLSMRMASLQEEIADDPLAMIAKRAKRVGESSQELDSIMEAHSLSLAHVLLDADKLRVDTLKELMVILTPLQAVDLLISTKKLHLSIHEWGKTRDQKLAKPHEDRVS